jgi:hypothetical protein
VAHAYAFMEMLHFIYGDDQCLERLNIAEHKAKDNENEETENETQTAIETKEEKKEKKNDETDERDEHVKKSKKTKEINGLVRSLDDNDHDNVDYSTWSSWSYPTKLIHILMIATMWKEKSLFQFVEDNLVLDKASFLLILPVDEDNLLIHEHRWLKKIAFDFSNQNWKVFDLLYLIYYYN